MSKMSTNCPRNINPRVENFNNPVGMKNKIKKTTKNMLTYVKITRLSEKQFTIELQN